MLDSTWDSETGIANLGKVRAQKKPDKII